MNLRVFRLRGIGAKVARCLSPVMIRPSRRGCTFPGTNTPTTTRVRCNDGGAYDSDNCTDNVDWVRLKVNCCGNEGRGDLPLTSKTSAVEAVLYYGTEYFFNGGVVTFCGGDGPSVQNRRQNCALIGFEYILGYWGFQRLVCEL